jgi:cystathionine beta-lyase
MPDTSSGSPFDRVLSRRGSNSEKWDSYPADVLPLFVADMDFAPPPPVLAALRASLEPGVFGYARSSADFGQALCDYLERRYRWQVTAEQLLFLPGLVCGLNLACRALTEPGDKVLVLTPIYPRFLSAPKNQGRALVAVPMAVEARDRTLHYRIDLEALESAIVQHHPRLLLLCSPHNPSGRVFSREELLALANLCLRHDMLICSDEIHCDLLLDDRPHLPLATLTPELAERTVTLLAPSKTYNIAGLQVGGAVATEPSLRARLKQAMRGLIPAPNLLGLLAGSVAYREGGAWLDAALDYLRENRDHLVRRVTEELPGIRCSVPEATYLAWLDCREAGIGDDPYQFFLQHARVALSDGRNFGDGGEGFVRLNFGCPRTTLDSALARMAAAMTS